MAHIILPHRWQQQPQYQEIIDSNLSYANGLRGGIVPLLSKSATYNPISRKLLSNSTYGVSQLSTSPRNGFVVSRGNGSNTNYNTEVLNGFTTSTPVSLFAIIVGTGATTNVSQARLMDNAGGGFTPVGISLGDGTNARIIGKWRDSGGTTRDFGSAPETTQAANGVYYILARVKSGEQTLWVNGVKSSASATTSGTFQYAPDYLTASPNGGIYNGLTLVWNRYLTDTEAYVITTNPWQIFRPLQRRIWVPVSAGGGPTYTLTAASGSFSLTGNAAGLTAARQIAAASGSYTLTGNAAGLTAARKITADAGGYTLTGNAANLTAARLLTAASGSFVLTGNDAALTYTPNVTYTLTAAAGSFTLTGNAANLTAARLLTAENGIFTLTGHDAALVGPGDEVATAPVGGGIGHGGKQRKRKVYIERNGKLHVFIDTDHADAFLNATKAVKEARKLPKAKQIKTAIKAAEKAISEAKPALVLPLASIPALAPNLHQAKTAEKLIQQAQWAHIVAMYEKWIDEDDEDILLLAA